MRSKVTTKKGDRGETVTISGDSYAKSHPLVECCGHLDSLRSFTALARLEWLDSGRDDAEGLEQQLMWLLHVYFLIGAQCNDPQNKHPEYRKGDVGPGHIETLEAYQEAWERRIELPRKFIVSASSVLSARFDVVCTVARQFERTLVTLKQACPEFDAQHILPFVNRLSDYLYIVARVLENGDHTGVDYTVLGLDE